MMFQSSKMSQLLSTKVPFHRFGHIFEDFVALHIRIPIVNLVAIDIPI